MENISKLLEKVKQYIKYKVTNLPDRDVKLVDILHTIILHPELYVKIQDDYDSSEDKGKIIITATDVYYHKSQVSGGELYRLGEQGDSAQKLAASAIEDINSLANEDKYIFSYSVLLDFFMDLYGSTRYTIDIHEDGTIRRNGVEITTFPTMTSDYCLVDYRYKYTKSGESKTETIRQNCLLTKVRKLKDGSSNVTKTTGFDFSGTIGYFKLAKNYLDILYDADTNNVALNTSQINIQRTYRETNSICSFGNFSNQTFHFPFDTGQIPLVHMGNSNIKFKVDGTDVAFYFKDTLRTFIDPINYARFLGAVIKYNLGGGTEKIRSTGMALADNSCYPSVSHGNGDSIDSVYMNDYDNQKLLLNSLFEFGVKKHYWQSNSHIQTYINEYPARASNFQVKSNHNDHLHSYL